MKTELKLAQHSVIPGALIVEIWYNGQFIGQVCGADGPGVRVLSKHSVVSEVIPGSVNVAEVKINDSNSGKH